MIEIPLTRGKVALVDDDDVERVSCYKWHLSGCGRYAMSTLGKGSYNLTSMHSIILGQKYVDHINKDGLDNRRQNLRPADNQQNQANTGPRVGKFKGVSWDKRRDKYRAQIMVNGKGKHLGYFSNEEDAAIAYDEAAKEYFGDYARTNF